MKIRASWLPLKHDSRKKHSHITFHGQKISFWAPDCIRFRFNWIILNYAWLWTFKRIRWPHVIFIVVNSFYYHVLKFNLVKPANEIPISVNKAIVFRSGFFVDYNPPRISGPPFISPSKKPLRSRICLVLLSVSLRYVMPHIIESSFKTSLVRNCRQNWGVSTTCFLCEYFF